MDKTDKVWYYVYMNSIISVGKQSKTYNVQKHSHSHWEIVYCSGGSGKFIDYQNETVVEYLKNEVVVIPPHHEHANVSEQGFTNINLIMKMVATPFSGITKILDNSQRHILKCLNWCYHYFNMDENNKPAILNNLAELLVSFLINYSDTPRYSAVVDNIRGEIIRCFSDCNFKIEKLLEEMPYNNEYLRKLFKKETDITPLQFLNNTRINAARKLLAGKTINRMSIAEIANMCGFNDSLYFSRIFKKHVGVSPISYNE